MSRRPPPTWHRPRPPRRLLDPAVWGYSEPNREERAMPENPRHVVNEQADDDGLWFVAATAPEAYLQAALRRLHRAVEQSPEREQEPAR